MSDAPTWLVERPIAHRCLHDAARGLIENTIEAAEAAIAAGFAVECDIQRAHDGEAVVFHDETLERLTAASGAVADRDAANLSALTLRGSSARVPTLPAFLAALSGRVPLICEIKSAFDGDTRLAERAAQLAADYRGPIAFKSFDPDVIAHLRRLRPVNGHDRPCPLGVVAMAAYTPVDFPDMSATQRRDCAAFAHVERTRPDFLSFCVDDLPHAVPTLLKALGGAPVMTWTVRSAAQREVARAYADQIVFEGAGRP